jgi:hypothetical protein
MGAYQMTVFSFLASLIRAASRSAADSRFILVSVSSGVAGRRSERIGVKILKQENQYGPELNPLLHDSSPPI